MPITLLPSPNIFLAPHGGARALLVEPPPSAVAERPLPHRTIRVLVVTARFYPDIGGTETHTHEVTKRMASHPDFDFTVLTTDRYGDRPVKEKLDAITILRCRAYPQNRDYYLAPDIYKHILHGRYDLVHCQGVHTAVPIIAMIAARMHRIPYLVTLHTGGHSSSLRGRLRTFHWRALGPLLRGAAAVVAVSRFEQRVFQKACGIDAERFTIIPNGGDLLGSGESTEITPGLIVSSGRLEKYKGHHRAIDALPIVRRTIPDATLRILGSGPYEDHLRSRIKSLGLQDSVTIEYVASHDRTQMAMALGRAAAVVALSEYEAHPVAVMEALTLGIPTVGLNTAGIGELAEAGLVQGVPRNASAETIAQALIAALGCRRAMVSAKLPTWDSAALSLAALYRETIATVPESLCSHGT